MHDAPPQLHCTMKTATMAAAAGSSHSYSHPYQTHSHSHRAPKSGGSSTTPLISPRYPYSVGQNQPPPKLSPARGPEVRSSSPNYFGLVVESSNDPRETSVPERHNWSPPSSSVKSFGAAIPAQVPLEANPEFEAFRRQTDSNRGKSFSLPSAGHVLHQPTQGPAPVRPRPSRWCTHTGDSLSHLRGHNSNHGHHASSASFGLPSSNRMAVDQESFHDSAYVSSTESKRNSESSLLPLQLGGLPTRFESPLSMDASPNRSTLTAAEDRDPRLSVMEHRADPPSPPHPHGEIARAATLPASLDADVPSMISGQQLKDMVKHVGHDRLLILDIRSAQNHATSHIKGSLNLCIPTTLLKRPTFNIQRLRQTFQGGEDSDKFSRWPDAMAIIVYDSHSSDRRDAVAAQNMIKKFTNEGYTGKTCILKGGFADFHVCHPDMVEGGSLVASGPGRPGACDAPGLKVAPVIGGVSLPSTAEILNPFFSNIRQNMDLADGVGQFKVDRPRGLESPLMPTWLREAASEQDQGKNVSDKFLKIEMDEKARMQSAYAAFNPQCAHGDDGVRLCGVEKGGKNRYKDILPFEHARVKLQGRPENSCDYVNASHVRSSRSNKRYIATQGPLPATYEDFWSMIWEQDVRVIVMLTAELEGGQLKCHPYWKEREHGPIRLKQLSEKKASLDMDAHRAEPAAPSSANPMAEMKRRRANTTTTADVVASDTPATKDQADAPYVIIRKFALVHAAHPFEPMREITHLHFSSWPDFGTPAQPSHLLGLVELANVMQSAAMPVETNSVMEGRSPTRSLSGSWHDEPESDARAKHPMLVHCSAGCGRTGTFCTVDSVIDMLKRQRRAKGAGVLGADPLGGDVPMVDAGDQQPAGSPGIDTSWLSSDTVDLIQKTVEDFRQQRLSMVQSLRQFVLCYETVLEWEHRMNNTAANLSGHRARSGSLAQSRRDR